MFAYDAAVGKAVQDDFLDGCGGIEGEENQEERKTELNDIHSVSVHGLSPYTPVTHPQTGWIPLGKFPLGAFL